MTEVTHEVEDLRDKYSFKIDRIMTDVDQVSVSGIVWDDPAKIPAALEKIEPALDAYRERVRDFVKKANAEVTAQKEDAVNQLAESTYQKGKKRK